SLYVDRSASADDSELNIESLIENLENMIMKELSVLCMTESPAFFPALSISFSAAFFQSSTPISVSGSPASATSIPTTSTLTTSALSGSVTSAFITSSPHFKKML
ncbi:hypothetical protein BDBG_16757, partial [Blastomyces gilchristii SLH14081]